ncbi:RDD family protein [Helicobacter sp. MIT 99-5507]|uniref:RDD family protein n=1 Tax=Helicobacter sp. MIT 99-5507 TaxID=152489 RepID=UPI000E1F1314|nr:RDD family protein [Helicobacter sp. MIT 99-5507]RDU58307.1 RDD family protein [Helicobacter sp. MIT 99-5507]
MDIGEILDREGLHLASNDKRILAHIIDDFIVSFIIFIAFYEQMMSLNGDIKALQQFVVKLVPYIILLAIIYHTIFTALYGGSIGKILCKIKVVRLDTLDKPSYLQSFYRSFIRTISANLLLYIPLLFAFVDNFKRAFHDIVMQTIVIDISIPQDI